MRTIGTVVRGVRAPIIRQGDDIAKIVADSVMAAWQEAGISPCDRDVVAVTESVVARAQGNYASVAQIAKDVRAKTGGGTVGVAFPILSRNRFSLLLRGMAAGCKKIVLLLSYPSDEVGNHLVDWDLLDEKGVNPYESVLVLSPRYFAKVLGNTDALVYGGDDAVKYGVVPGLYGFRDVICTSYLPEGTVGAIVPYGTLGVASRVNAPAINGYVATFNAQDENGFALGFRVFEHLCEGRMILGGDVLFGAKILQDGIVRLVNA